MFFLQVKVSDFETVDFMEYGNMFYNYRMVSVWSAPEAIARLKKIPVLTPELDIYSYSMILWELWHEAVPFDNDIAAA